jgi:hypothetical protein
MRKTVMVVRQDLKATGEIQASPTHLVQQEKS